MTKRTASIFASLLLCAFALNAGQRAAQTFDGVKMFVSPIALQREELPPLPDSEVSGPLPVVSGPTAPVSLLTAPAPHLVTLEWYQPGNVLRHGIEEAPTPLGPWKLVAVRWNDFIYANTTLRVTFTSTRNPAFWRVFASNTR